VCELIIQQVLAKGSKSHIVRVKRGGQCWTADVVTWLMEGVMGFWEDGGWVERDDADLQILIEK